MKAFNYYAPTEIVFGCGRVLEIGQIAARYGKKSFAGNRTGISGSKRAL